MSEGFSNQRTVTIKQLRQASAPIAIETRTHGSVAIRPIWTGEDYAAIATALKSHNGDTTAIAVAVLQALQAPNVDHPVELAGWSSEEIASLIHSYMTSKRSGFEAPDSSDSVIEDFVRQCELKVNSHYELVQQAMATVVKSINQRLSNLPNIAVTLGQMAFDPASLAPRVDMSAFSRAVNNVVVPTLDLSPLTRSVSEMWSERGVFQGFFRQSANLWESMQALIDSLAERTIRDELLRSMGIDADRLRVAGVYDWLSFVSSTLDKAESEQGATAALIECAKAGVLQNKLFDLLDELPDDVRKVRKEAVRQGIETHNQGLYVASCTVLIAQLDGLIGDILVDWQRHKGVCEDRQRGMRARIKSLDNFFDPHDQYPSIIASNDDFAAPRNALAHGDPKADYSEAHSAKQIFLILSLLSVHISQDDNTDEYE